MSKDAETDFKDYGPQKGLQEILEELAVYCATHGSDTNPQFKVILPKNVLEQYQTQCFGKMEHVHPIFNPLMSKKPIVAAPVDHSAVFVGGVCELFNTDDYRVVRRRKNEKAKSNQGSNEGR